MIKDFLSWYIRPTPCDVERRIPYLVQHAWDNILFYRRRMEETGITPAHVTCLNDYAAKFPISTSAKYRAHQQAANSKGLVDPGRRIAYLFEDRSSDDAGGFLFSSPALVQ